MRSSPSSDSHRVARYFDRHAEDFDSIYRTDKPALRRLRDSLTRGTVLQRLDFVEAYAAKKRPRRVLDVGTGAGRFAIALARTGSTVVGLDFAPEMINLANDAAEEAGVAGACTFLATDYLTWHADAPFDLGLAIGLFDYVEAPGPLLAKLAGDCGGTLIASFPRRFHPLVPLRWARLTLNQCPVHFYSRRDVARLARDRLGRFRIEVVGRDYLLIGGP